MLIIALLANTLLFGLMGLSSKKLNPLNTPLAIQMVLNSDVVGLLISIGYFLTFPFIVFPSDSYIRNIIIALAMQFLINHLIWGTVFGLVGGVKTRKTMREINRSITNPNKTD